MDRYRQIAYALTAVVAICGILVGAQLVSWWVVAIAGVVAGLWWAFGNRFLPQVATERSIERDARRRERDR